ncbi:MAG: RNA polymerase sigma factor [bacterium]|nr:RNA polymerase sigma factor [bacterium]
MEFLHTHKQINAWAEEFKAGQHQAAEKMFNHFYPAIYRFARSRINDKDAAADIAQNVFLKVARMIITFDQKKGNFNTWIWQIARNTLTDHLRGVQRNQTNSESAMDKSIDEYAEAPKSTMMTSSDAYHVIDIVKTFPPEDQELFRLRYISELSYEEISTITGRTENALRVAVHRIREKIRLEYKDYDK